MRRSRCFCSSPGVSRCFCSSLLLVTVAVPAPWSFAPVSTARISETRFSLRPSSSLLLPRILPLLSSASSSAVARCCCLDPPSSHILRPVVAFFCSFSPVSLIFLPARSPARRMRTKRGEDEREDEVQSLSSLGLKGADVTYGSRPDCTQLFRRAILMPWTPSANHPLLLLLSSSSSSASSSSSSVSSSSSSSSSPTPSSSLVDVVVVVGVLVFFMARSTGPSLSSRYERLLSVPIMQ